MPTSTLRLAGLRNRMQLGSAFQPSYRAATPLISVLTEYRDEWNSLGRSFASITYPSTNRALGYMFTLADYFLVQKVWWMNGTTATTDNADVGVYSEAGTTLIVSGGATLIATANIVQEVNCTDTLLQPGRYWCVYNQNGVTATPTGVASTAVELRSVIGAAQFAGAVPLGATFTPAAVAGVGIPLFGVANRTQVA